MACGWSIYIFFLLLTSTVHCKCPELCKCHAPTEDENYVIINCDDAGLTDIPSLNFTDRTKIFSLSLRNNSFVNVTLRSEHFQNVNIVKIDLSNNRFLKIERNLFASLNGSLQELTADNIGTDLSFLNALSTLSALEKFSFRNNIEDVSDFPQGYFGGTKIKYLNLSENNLGYIADNAFSNINSTLITLILNNAGVTFSDIKFLKGLSNLERLSIDGSDDSQLSSGTFKDLGLSKLRSLSIRNGEILLIRSLAFRDVENLETIDLSNNKLKQVPSDPLLLVPNLKSLNLSYNKDIESIVQGAFDGLSQLEMLDLRGTGINLIQEGGLASSLKTLILSNCSLPEDSFFLVGAFRKLGNLEVLELSYNSRLSRIYNSTFDYLAKLRVLDLSGNRKLRFSDTVVKGLEDGLEVLKLNNMGLHSVPVDVISSLANLKRLEFAGNLLVNLSANFLGLRSESELAEIDVRNNNISTIAGKAFVHIKKNLTLLLDGNNIGNLRFVSSYGACFFKKLSLTKNPIVCRCGIEAAIGDVCGDVTGTCLLGNSTYIDLTSDISLDCDNTASGASTLIKSSILISLILIFSSILLAEHIIR